MSLFDRITAEGIRALREKTGVSMQECRRALARNRALQVIDSASSIDDLKELLRELVKASF